MKIYGHPPMPSLSAQPLKGFRQEKKSYKAKVEPTQGKKLNYFA